MTYLIKILNRSFIITLVVFSLFFNTPSVSFAQTPNCNESQLKAMGVAMLNCGNENVCSTPTSPAATTTPANPITSTPSTVIKATPEAQAVAHQPITVTWGISDSSIEQWFLKQSSVSRLVRFYGLNPGNITEVTNTVKEAGLSPVYFYLYAVEEGSKGEFHKNGGGYINHYSIKSAPPGHGDKITDAKNDANYLVSRSKLMTSNPSWVDGGHPVDFVPKEIQDAGNADFKNMPPDTIGRAYIPATAATTWEYYFPDGRFKSYNTVQDYAAPLTSMIENIRKLGGDPLQGGNLISNSCSGSANNEVTGEGLTKAVNWAKMIANNNGYGYSQPRRATGFVKWQSDPNCTESCGDLDCSSFVSAAFTVGGYFDKTPNFTTAYMENVLIKIGFTSINDPNSNNVKFGDILWRKGHTAIYVGDGQIAHASTSDGNDTVGDGSGKEVLIAPFRPSSWVNGKIFRAPN